MLDSRAAAHQLRPRQGNVKGVSMSEEPLCVASDEW
jgi:hypothetical protein